MLIKDVKNIIIIKNYDYYTAVKIFTSIAASIKLIVRKVEMQQKPVHVWLQIRKKI